MLAIYISLCYLLDINTKHGESKMQAFPTMTCRKCDAVNPMVYFAPVNVAPTPATCICFDCANARQWLDSEGNVRKDVNL